MKLLSGVIKVVVTCALASRTFLPAAADDATLKLGADIYHERCVICHGGEGFGDGLLPMYMGTYPNTALLSPINAATTEEIADTIRYGGTQGGSDKSPPWVNELSEEEIKATAELIALMRSDRDTAFALLDETRPPSVPTQREGRVLFKTYCSRCHGEQGYGDGRMSKVYKNPPPYPLVYSIMPGAYVTNIITNGGASVGRSEVMPNFGGQLSESQIQSVILHLYSIRQIKTPRY